MAANIVDLGRLVGRGGAGNWRIKGETQSDPEAQDNASPAEISAALAQAQAQQPPAPYTRAGRGGAGNVYDAAAMAASREERSTSTKEKTAKPAHTTPRLSGRGGAGNWAAHQSAQEAQQEAEERRKAAALEAQVIQEVEAELPPPPKTYHKTTLEKEGRDGDGMVAETV